MISDKQIWDAVKKAQLEATVDINNQEDFVAAVAAISTKATLQLIGVNSGGETHIEPIGDMPFPIIFAEWAQQFVLKTHFDRFLAVMLYLREREGKHAINTLDIGHMYDKARWKKPANMADVFAKGAERIYFAEAEEAASEEGLKMWQMTRTGYEYLMSIKAEV